MAAAEMAGDKMPFAPDRRIPPSIAARLTIGAVGGLALSQRDTPPWSGVLIGMAGAVAGTLLGRRARGANTRTTTDWARGLTEDLVVAGLAMTVVHLAERQARAWEEKNTASKADTTW